MTRTGELTRTTKAILQIPRNKALKNSLLRDCYDGDGSRVNVLIYRKNIWIQMKISKYLLTELILKKDINKQRR